MTGGKAIERAIGAAARGAGSAAAAVGLALPLVAVAGAVATGRLSAQDAAAMWSVRIWSVALAIAVVLAVTRAVIERRLEVAVGALAALASVATPAACLAGRFDGLLSAGIGEVGAPWISVAAGPLATPPTVEILDVGAEAGRTLLRVDGRELEVPLGRETRVGEGDVIRVDGPYAAPSFRVAGDEVVLSPDGGAELSGLLKLFPGDREEFQVGFLPHRFLLSVPADAPPVAAGATPSRLRVVVMRGKMRVLDRVIAPDEPVRFERLTFSYGEGAAWARVRFRSGGSTRRALFLAVALGTLALGAAALETRRAR